MHFSFSCRFENWVRGFGLHEKEREEVKRLLIGIDAGARPRA